MSDKIRMLCSVNDDVFKGEDIVELRPTDPDTCGHDSWTLVLKNGKTYELGVDYCGDEAYISLYGFVDRNFGMR